MRNAKLSMQNDLGGDCRGAAVIIMRKMEPNGIAVMMSAEMFALFAHSAMGLWESVIFQVLESDYFETWSVHVPNCFFSFIE